MNLLKSILHKIQYILAVTLVGFFVALFRVMRAMAAIVIMMIIIWAIGLGAYTISPYIYLGVYVVGYLLLQVYKVDVDLFKFGIGLPSVNQYVFHQDAPCSTYSTLATNALANGDYEAYARYQSL